MIIAFPLVCFDWSPFLEMFDYFSGRPCPSAAVPTARDELIHMIVDASHLEFKCSGGLLQLLSLSGESCNTTGSYSAGQIPYYVLRESDREREREREI